MNLYYILQFLVFTSLYLLSFFFFMVRTVFWEIKLAQILHFLNFVFVVWNVNSFLCDLF